MRYKKKVFKTKKRLRTKHDYVEINRQREKNRRKHKSFKTINCNIKVKYYFFETL